MTVKTPRTTTTVGLQWSEPLERWRNWRNRDDTSQSSDFAGWTDKSTKVCRYATSLVLRSLGVWISLFSHCWVSLRRKIFHWFGGAHDKETASPKVQCLGVKTTGHAKESSAGHTALKCCLSVLPVQASQNPLKFVDWRCRWLRNLQLWASLLGKRLEASEMTEEFSSTPMYEHEQVQKVSVDSTPLHTIYRGSHTKPVPKGYHRH